MCCGFWNVHDWLIAKVDEECEDDNSKQLQHISGLVSPMVRQHCTDYKQGSVMCRMLVIVPIIIISLSLLSIIGVCVCAHVSLYKWMHIRKKYQNYKQYSQRLSLSKEHLKIPEKLLNDKV